MHKVTLIETAFPSIILENQQKNRGNTLRIPKWWKAAISKDGTSFKKYKSTPSLLSRHYRLVFLLSNRNLLEIDGNHTTLLAMLQKLFWMLVKNASYSWIMTDLFWWIDEYMQVCMWLIWTAVVGVYSNTVQLHSVACILLMFLCKSTFFCVFFWRMSTLFCRMPNAQSPMSLRMMESLKIQKVKLQKRKRRPQKLLLKRRRRTLHWYVTTSSDSL